MKELRKIARAAQTVNDVRYVDLKQNEFNGLNNVVGAIQEDVTALDEKE